MDNQETLPAVQQGSDLMPVALSTDQVLEQLNKIKDLMRRGMVENTHYGKIPGCGPKPALLDPGADEINFMFRIVPRFTELSVVEEENFISYRIQCDLHAWINGEERIVGEGRGACNSREEAYLYRTVWTKKKVPQKYWDNRDQSLLGGPTYHPKKTKDGWVIIQKVKVDNVWDSQHDIYAKACKRAKVRATRNATPAGSLFVEGIEDNPEKYAKEPPEDIKPVTVTTSETTNTITQPGYTTPTGEPNPFDGEEDYAPLDTTTTEPTTNGTGGYVVRVKGHKDIRIVGPNGADVEYKQVLKENNSGWRWNTSHAKWCWSMECATVKEAEEWIGWVKSLEVANKEKGELQADFIVMGDE